MGLIRKLTSVGTVGLVDFRSDKERAAAYGKGARKHARRQARELKKQTKVMKAQRATAFAMPPAPTGPPPGWYADPNGAPVQRWWDGTRWTEHTQTS